MTFGEESFRSAIDKGTLDALLPDSGSATTATAMIEEVWRVLKVMGSYTVISLSQDHVLRTLIDSFLKK